MLTGASRFAFEFQRKALAHAAVTLNEQPQWMMETTTEDVGLTGVRKCTLVTDR